ncbi:RHS repeat-associated core domain-containing protein [Micromonospora sp. NPDC005324]|uniref:RHS repeat-associated core domain-containing protein n=1 Tax=Micromonospora sp. NPDC005324 TaxID=3157033 RepID=UPI0033BFB0B3
MTRVDGQRMAGPVSLTVNYGAFRQAFGGDWARRLRLAEVLADGKTTPLPSRNDVRTSQVTADAVVEATARTFTLTADAGSATGDYKATSLAPAAAWQVSQQSGSFNWSYDLNMPPVPGGLKPELKFSYSSGAVDGRISSTNNQTSWVGEGWNLWPGFVERSYKGCADDLGGNNEQRKTGDLCWETDNATLSLNGQSSDLVLENGVWHKKIDDGTRIERLTGAENGDDDGEHWRITTTEGVQYVFGRNRLPGWSTGKAETGSTWTVPVFGNDPGEPCRSDAGYATSSCDQAYRWNLDYVVDPNDNSMSYWYQRETNLYGKNMGTAKAPYTRGGTLARIEYGTRAGAEFAGPAPAQVVFERADRCLAGATCAESVPASWPDVPWDLQGTDANYTTKLSPTFWSTKKLGAVNTQIATGGGNYQNVDRWELTQSYPSPGDKTSPAMWLGGIVRTGQAGPPVKLPAVTFDGQPLANRVDSGPDGAPAMYKYRLRTINNETGGSTTVAYLAPDCAAGATPAVDSNTKRCFPVRWVLPPEPTPRNDWFHKYVVAKVSEKDLVGGAPDKVSTYEYVGHGAWAYSDDQMLPAERRTWSQWRGYEKLIVRQGDPAAVPDSGESETQYQYFRGMHGDRTAAGGSKSVSITDSTNTSVTDDEPYAGLLREKIVRNGRNGAVVTSTIETPWKRLTATQGSLKSHQVQIVKTVSRTALAAGGFRSTQVERSYDMYGNETQVNDSGDMGTGGDEICTTTRYVLSTNAMLVSLPSEQKAVGVACGAAPSYPADVISDVRTSYDGQEFGVAPIRGDVTAIQNAKSYAGSTPTYITTRSEYDAFGRPVKQYDARNNKSTIDYTEANGLTTGVTVTNALGHQSVTTTDPARGSAITVLDASNRRTDLRYDGLGRLTAVWQPGRSQALGDGPSIRHDYQVRVDGPGAVRTEKLGPNNNYVVTYALSDGLGRPRQTQAPSPAGGRIITDTTYDTRGLNVLTRAAYYNNASGPRDVLYNPVAEEVPNATRTVFDGAGRATASTFLKNNVEQQGWGTATVYGGDRTTVIPPRGGTATTTLIDADGNTTELRQYHAATATGAFDTTRYTYTKQGLRTTITDPAGNVWRHEYDVLGRKIKIVDPDKGTTMAGYDDLGNQVSSTDARGRVTTATYDALNRRTGTWVGATRLAEWKYDVLTRAGATSKNVPGVLVSSSRYLGSAAYTRKLDEIDAFNRPTSESVVIPAAETGIAGTYTTRTTYRADGSRASTQLPTLGNLAAETVVYGYDNLAKAASSAGSGMNLSTMTYNELGEPSKTTVGSGTRKAWQMYYYEEGSRRLNRIFTDRSGTGDTIADDRTYSYDPAGNVVRAENLIAGAGIDVQCYGYDYLRRMTNAWTPAVNCDTAAAPNTVGGPAPYWHTFSYDVAGNRKSFVQNAFGAVPGKTSTYTYPEPGSARPHAVASIATTGAAVVNYGYDGSGNLSTRPGQAGTQTLDWSDEGLLAGVNAGATQTTYVYDADGNQLIRRDPGAVTLFTPSGELQYSTTSGAKAGTRRYDGAIRTGSGLSWLVNDRQGTANVAIDSATLQVSYRRTDAFGNQRDASPNWAGGGAGFVGGVENSVTGLTRLGAREYDSKLGTFISVDPLLKADEPQQLNAYAYANNSPATLSDPSGLLADYDDCRCNYNGNPLAKAKAEAKAAKGSASGKGDVSQVAEMAKVAQRYVKNVSNLCRRVECNDRRTGRNIVHNWLGENVTREYLDVLTHYAQEANIDPRLLLAVLITESGDCHCGAKDDNNLGVQSVGLANMQVDAFMRAMSQSKGAIRFGLRDTYNLTDEGNIQRSTQAAAHYLAYLGARHDRTVPRTNSTVSRDEAIRIGYNMGTGGSAAGGAQTDWMTRVVGLNYFPRGDPGRIIEDFREAWHVSEQLLGASR